MNPVQKMDPQLNRCRVSKPTVPKSALTDPHLPEKLTVSNLEKSASPQTDPIYVGVAENRGP